MAYQPIENYGIIGNMRTAALVSIDGSIDWYCFPHFDSPGLFAAILDDDKKRSGRDCRNPGGRHDLTEQSSGRNGWPIKRRTMREYPQ